MPQNDELISLFPIPLLVCAYQWDYSEELKWIRSVESWRENEDSYNRQSTDTFILDHPELKKIRTFIETKLNTFVSQTLGSEDRLAITQSWLNKNEKGESHHEHVHPNSILSGVFYLRQDKTLPPIQFAKSNQHGIKLDPKKYNNLNSETFLLPCVDGELLLFPSNLKHSVLINRGKEERISLSFNTFSVDTLGSEKSLTHLDIRRIMNEHN